MAKLLQIDFHYTGPFGKEMAEGLNDLAISIAEEPGFIWKVWTERESDQLAGGIYLFESEETAQAYLDKHLARIGSFGVSEARAYIFDVNEDLCAITNGPLRGS